MNRLLIQIIALAALFLYTSAAPTAFIFQQVQQSPNSTESYVSVGCCCVRSNETLGVVSTLTNLLDCFCLHDFDKLPVNNNTAIQNQTFTSIINSLSNTPNQTTLACTCAFPNSSDVSQTNSSFLLPGYNGSSFVPVECTCARAIDYVRSVAIPILNITITVPVSDPKKQYENLIPLGCYCSSRLDLFKDLQITQFSPSIPVLLCKCLPVTNVSDVFVIQGSGWSVPTKTVSLDNLNLEVSGFDANPILANISSQPVPAGVVLPIYNLTVPAFNVSLRPPPFVDLIPPQPASGQQPQSVKNKRIRLA